MTSNAPRNAWYPLTWSRNVTRALARHRLLGDDLVVYRSEAGAPIALDDMCPHRLAPLSMGKLRGDAVECGYHGMTFAPNGRCIRIPGQPVIPPSARDAGAFFSIESSFPFLAHFRCMSRQPGVWRGRGLPASWQVRPLFNRFKALTTRGHRDAL